MKLIIYILCFLVLAISAKSQNTKLQALDLGYEASSFTYTDTKNTLNFTNDFEGQSSNDVFYKFTLTRAMDIVISHCGSELDDTYLHLLDANGNQIGENDDYSGAGGCSNMYNSYLKKINLTIGTYYVVSEGYSDDGNITTTIQGIRPAEVTGQNGGFDPSTGENYILTVTPTIESTDASTLSTDQSIQTIQYFDGLGRPIETVQLGITPDKSDLVSFIEYDGVGRENKQWLPTNIANNKGAFVGFSTFEPTAKSQLLYNSDSRPFNETKYEPSPLNRVEKQLGIGQSWLGHSVITQYSTNDGNIAYFFVNSAGNLERGSNYAAETLYKTQVIDEDGKITIEYKDKLGQVIMKQSSTDVKTYYAYNDLGQLCYVIPPKAVDELTGDLSDDNTVVKQLCYLYKYDERGNCIQKRLPGCEWIYIVYDNANRLVLSQDGNQRKSLNWTQICYDVLGRMLYSTVIKTDADHRMLISAFSSILQTDIFSSSPAVGAIQGIGYSIYPNYSITYRRPSIPGGPVYQPVNIDIDFVRLLTVNYYDDYLFTSLATNGSNLNWVTPPAGYDEQYSSAKGLLTGTRTYILDNTNKYTSTALYYDDRGQMVQSRSTNHLEGYDLLYNRFDFTGKILKTKKDHNIANHPTYITEVYRNEYDQSGRLLKVRYVIDTNDTITLAQNIYDELGRPIQKLRHNNKDFEQYEYNIRNWTTKIKSGEFEENLYYNSGPGANYYNGNISYQTWKYNGALNHYAYLYDELNRLIDADNEDLNAGTNYSESLTEYDKMGNITHLEHHRGNEGIDMLDLTYNGNQLKKVTDWDGNQALYNVKEYKDLVDLPTEFIYDANGNMTTDLDRDIVTIRYNLLNLPDTIQFKNGNQIINKYDASGLKLSTRYYTLMYNITPLVVNEIRQWEYDPDIIDETGTFYIENYEYGFNGCDPGWYWKQRINNTEGFVACDNEGKYDGYLYYRRDHLGNNREVWNASANTTVQRTQYYPSGLPWASTSSDNPGLQSKKYNGKEFVEMHGYDTYDYGARGYYPAIGRFTTIDRFAEKYPWQSPYCYAANNPVNYIDVNGDSIWINYKDANGQQQRMQYTQGMEYKGNDSFILSVVSSLNKMSSVDIGKTVLDKLSGSQSNYNLSNTFATDKNGNVVKDALSFDAKTNEIHAGVLVNNPTMQESQKMESAGHELFHAYQTEFGETGSTINREVGAYVFGRALSTNLGYGTLGYGYLTPVGQLYENAMTNLSLSPTFNQQAYNTAISNFLQGATVNINGDYNRFIIRSNDINPVIKSLYPLVR